MKLVWNIKQTTENDIVFIFYIKLEFFIIMKKITSEEKNLVSYDLYLDIGYISFFDRSFMSTYDVIQLSITTLDHSFSWKSKFIQLHPMQDTDDNTSSIQVKKKKKSMVNLVVQKQKELLLVEINKKLRLCINNKKILNVVFKVRGFSIQNTKCSTVTAIKNAKKSIRENIICEAILGNKDLIEKMQIGASQNEGERRKSLNNDNQLIAEIKYSCKLKYSLDFTKQLAPSLSLTPKQRPNEHQFTIQINDNVPRCDFWAFFKKDTHRPNLKTRISLK